MAENNDGGATTRSSPRKENPTCLVSLKTECTIFLAAKSSQLGDGVGILHLQKIDGFLGRIFSSGSWEPPPWPRSHPHIYIYIYIYNKLHDM
jgi:hypothetical protein